MAFATVKPASAAPNVSSNGLLNPYPTLAGNTAYGLLNQGTTVPASVYQSLLGNTSSTSSTTPPTPAAAKPLAAPQAQGSLMVRLAH